MILRMLRRTQKRGSNSTLIWTLFLTSFCVSLLQSSCSYHEHFKLIVNTNRFPCVGVVRFTFTVEDLSNGEAPIFREKVSASSEANDLFWTTSSASDQRSIGQCQLFVDGIALKNIPYGSERQLTIKGLDSSGQIVSFGKSPSFLVESSGSHVETEVRIELTRGCIPSGNGSCNRVISMGLATLVIRFPTASVPTDTGFLEFALTTQTSQNPPPFKRTIRIEGGQIPSFISLTNVPTGKQKQSFVITAYKKGTKQKLREWTGEYLIPKDPSPQSATKRVVVVIKK